MISPTKPTGPYLSGATISAKDYLSAFNLANKLLVCDIICKQDKNCCENRQRMLLWFLFL